jgi:1-acyl-sn-glycerol-3-phosphate acyltransferase
MLAVTAVDWVLWRGGSLLLAPWRERRAAWHDRLIRHWARGIGRRLGLDWRVVGRPPAPPFLLVANHLSYADVFPLLAVTGAAFVAKAEIGSWPLVGHLCRMGGMLLIDRTSRRDLLRVGRAIEERLAAGGGVILFPEGTTGRGDGLLPFKASLLEVAAGSGTPVWYATVSYRTPPGAPPPAETVYWWGDATFLPHFLRLMRVPRIETTLAFGAEPIADSDRKRLAARLRAAMAAQLAPSTVG